MTCRAASVKMPLRRSSGLCNAHLRPIRLPSHLPSLIPRLHAFLPLSSRPFSSPFSSLSSNPLIRAHGPTGHLTSLLLPPSSTSSLKSRAVTLPDLVLSKRQLCDIELLLNGGFSPLTGFMSEAEYTAVVHGMRLPDGTLFPMPITLDVSEKKALDLKYGQHSSVALKDEEGNLIAVLDISDIYRPDKEKEAQLVFGGDPVSSAAASYAAAAFGGGGADVRVMCGVCVLRVCRSIRRWCTWSVRLDRTTSEGS